MHSYIISVVGAALLASAASILSPEKWRKYVNIITGMVLVCTIAVPIMRSNPSEMFSSFDDSEFSQEEGEQLQKSMIEEQLEEKIDGDIEERLKNEFNITAHAQCLIDINNEGKIAVVKKISVSGAVLSAKVAARLCEVYGVDKIENQ